MQHLLVGDSHPFAPLRTHSQPEKREKDLAGIVSQLPLSACPLITGKYDPAKKRDKMHFSLYNCHLH